MKKTYKHTDKFYKKKYKDYLKYAKKEGILWQAKASAPDLTSFKETYDAYREMGVDNIDRALKYDLKYETGYKTALSEVKALKELDLKNRPTFKELKEMSTREFAERYETDIMMMYNQKKLEGLSPVEAGKFISQYWFGSE